MRIALAPLLLVACVLLIAAPAIRAEVPNRSVESMRESASVVVTGTVSSIHVSKVGRSESRIYTIRVASVQKGDAKPGDHVLVSTWHTTQLPGAVGSNGHRGTPALGATITVYAGAEKSRSAPATSVHTVILPNGFQPAPPIFATPELLNSSPTIEQLDEAAGKAAAAEAWQECETLVRAGAKLAPSPDRSLLLLRSLAGQNRLADVLREGEAALKIEKDVRSKSFGMLWLAAYSSAHDLNDKQALIRLLRLRAQAEGTPAAWGNVLHTLEFLPDGPEVREAIAEAKKNARP